MIVKDTHRQCQPNSVKRNDNNVDYYDNGGDGGYGDASGGMSVNDIYENDIVWDFKLIRWGKKFTCLFTR